MLTIQSEGIKPVDRDRPEHKNAVSCYASRQAITVCVCFSVCCYHASAHQLLNNSLHQGGKGVTFALPVVIDVLDQFWDHFGVRFGLKFVSFGDLQMDTVKIYY